MSAFNRFGATANDVLRLLKNVGISDMSAIDISAVTVTGQTVAEAALDWATGQVVGWMSDACRRLLSYVELEIVESYASAGQTTVTMGIKPVSGDARVYVYPHRPDTRPYGDGVGGTLVAATGVFTLDTPLSSGQVVYASYKPDRDGSSFDMPTLSEWVAIGATAQLGGRLYGPNSAEFAQIEYYRTQFWGGTDNPGVRGDLQAGVMPSEFAKLQFWDSHSGAKTIGTVRKGRA
jgi:hypothetical protein